MDAKLERGTQNHQTQTTSSEPPVISIQTVDDLVRSETKSISSPIGSSCQHSILYQRTNAATSPAKSRASPNTSTSPTGNLFSADVQSTTPAQSQSTLLQELTDTEMRHIPNLSEAVYVGLCRDIGTPTEVRIRRDVEDTEEVVMMPLRIMVGYNRMRSGSHREGFRLLTSDNDSMLWLPDHKVICDRSQISLYRKPQHTVILMECEDLPPGYTRLKLMTTSLNRTVDASCISTSNGIYISSCLFRTQCLGIQQARSTCSRFSVRHGPCATYNFMGLDIDHAYCFRSLHWPDVAFPWIQGCHRKHWPQDSILSLIIKEGCHIVPISSLPENSETGIDWRISFSGAELKLVYSMNHCQFLCYGILKIFLKEVINADKIEPYLCSYFMKTIMFWVIQNDSRMNWLPQNLLTCFWTCFKLLVSWVYRGECPNFFIPQNNMFRLKVVGHTQAVLFDQLYSLYCIGLPCLLLSPTLQKYLKLPILDRTLTFRTDEGSIISGFLLDQCLFCEVTSNNVTSPTDFRAFIGFLISIQQVLMSGLSKFQAVTAQYFLSKLIQNFSWLLSNQIKHTLSNKKRYFICDNSLKTMKLASTVGCASDILSLAMLYYKIFQYEQSLRYLQQAHDNISNSYDINKYCIREEVYRGCMEGVPLIDRMKKCIISDIKMHNEYVYIDELIPEQKTDKTYGAGVLFIPPFVMLHMLFVLNHHKLGDTVKSQQSLQDLHTLLLSDDKTRVPIYLRDISWQILGICQQTCGDYVGALNSFQCSLQELHFHKIQTSTKFRIQRINDCNLTHN